MWTVLDYWWRWICDHQSTEMNAWISEWRNMSPLHTFSAFIVILSCLLYTFTKLVTLVKYKLVSTTHQHLTNLGKGRISTSLLVFVRNEMEKLIQSATGKERLTFRTYLNLSSASCLSPLINCLKTMDDHCWLSLWPTLWHIFLPRCLSIATLVVVSTSCWLPAFHYVISSKAQSAEEGQKSFLLSWLEEICRQFDTHNEMKEGQDDHLSTILYCHRCWIVL